MQIIVLTYELLKLRLNIENALCRKFKFNQRHSSFLEVLEKAYFRWLQEHQTSSFAIRTPCCSANAMDVILLRLGLASRLAAYKVLLATYTRIVRRVKLDNPVHGRYLG